MDTDGKNRFLRNVLNKTRNPSEVFDQVLVEYRVSGPNAKLKLVMALVLELTAYHAAQTYIGMRRSDTRESGDVA